MNLTSVILTKNEEINIEHCLKSLSFCDEILVIDDFSEDDTIKKVQNYNQEIKIFKRHLNGNFAAQRNYGLNKARGKWILFIDADESISRKLEAEIIKYTHDKSTKFQGYYFKREDVIWGKKLRYGETGAVRLLRLAKRHSGKWIRIVHETWEIEGETSLLKNPILHYPHPTLREFINDINIMSSLHAKANMEEGKNSSLSKIIIWPLGKFIFNYIIKFGFLDGVPGYVLAGVMSLNSFLAWSKLWFYQKGLQKMV
jgi:glycosyltransferase involved in cell wall biosynthesis